MAIDKRKNVNKYFPESEETQKGHMRNLHKNMRSTSRTTKKKKTSVNTLHPADAIRLHYAKTDFRLDGGSAAQISQPPKHTKISKPIEKKNAIFIQVYNPIETLYTDQTGKFPVRSSSGQHYQVVSHHVDSNWTLIETTSRCTEGELIGSRRKILTRMKQRGIIPKHQLLDNEISEAYKAEIDLTSMTYQLVLPDDHRHNISKKEIQTWKYHFFSFMSGAAATFPQHLWCQAIPQAKRQLMLLRQSNIHPTISAYAHVYCQHDYSAHLFVPIGMETLVHDKTHRRNTFPNTAAKDIF